MGDECFKLIEDFIHSSEEDLPVGRELLNQVNAFFNQVSFLCLVNRFRCQFDNSCQNKLCILLVCYDCQQLYRFLCQSDVVILQTLEQHILPPINALLVNFQDFDQCSDSKIPHVTVCGVKELVQRFMGTLD